MWSTVAIDLIGFGIVLPILPRYAERYGADALTIGLLAASFSVAQLIFSPIWGRLSDRIGRKPVLLISLFGTALGSLLTGIAGSLTLLFVGRIVDGASGASVSVAQAAAADLAGPRERAKLMGLLGAAFGVGFVVGPALGGLAAWLGGPHLPFFIAAALALVNALVAIKRLPETSPAHRPVAAEDPEPDGDGTLRFRPDIEVDDLEAARARVEALGGRLVKVIRAKPGEEHLRMADPEGNEFTLVLPDPVRPEGFHLR